MFYGAVNGFTDPYVSTGIGTYYPYYYGYWGVPAGYGFNFLGYLGSSYAGYGIYSSGLVYGLNFDFTLTTSQTEPAGLTIGQQRYDLGFGRLVPMEPIANRQAQLIPDESLPPSHDGQPTSDVPGLPGTLEPVEVTGPDVREVTANGFDGLHDVLGFSSVSSTTGDGDGDSGGTENLRSLWSDSAFGQFVNKLIGEMQRRAEGVQQLIDHFGLAPNLANDVAIALSDPLAWQASFENAIRALSPEEKQEYFWKGVEYAANVRSVPTGIVTWLKERNQAVEASKDPGYQSGLFSGTLYLSDATINRFARLGKFPGLSITEAQDTRTLGIVFNEAFHAYFDHSTNRLAWLAAIMNDETQFGSWLNLTRPRSGGRFAKAEEAMSETIQQVVSVLVDNGKILRYDEIIADHSTDWYKNLTPQHENKWPNDATIHEPMSEMLYYATIYFLFNPGKDPYFGEPVPLEIKQINGEPFQVTRPYGDIAVLKRFFAKTFRPQWSAAQVARFTGEQ